MKTSLRKMVADCNISLIIFTFVFISCSKKNIDDCVWTNDDNSYSLSFFPEGYFSLVSYDKSSQKHFVEGKWVQNKDSIKFYLINAQNKHLKAYYNHKKLVLFENNKRINLSQNDSIRLRGKMFDNLLLVKDSFFLRSCTLKDKRYYNLIYNLLDHKVNSKKVSYLRDCMCVQLDNNKVILSFIRKEKINRHVSGFEYIDKHLVVYLCNKSFLLESNYGSLFYECSIDGEDDFAITDDEEYFVTYGKEKDSFKLTHRTF